jgi:hypothetical protein
MGVLGEASRFSPFMRRDLRYYYANLFIFNVPCHCEGGALRPWQSPVYGHSTVWQKIASPLALIGLAMTELLIHRAAKADARGKVAEISR